jgi:HAD superfamily hydrolase (TIGR01549 family)
MTSPCVRALIFDFDGTIADTFLLRLKSWKDAFKKFGIATRELELESHLYNGLDDEALAQAVCGKEFAERWQGIANYRDVLRRSYANEIKLFPDVNSAISELYASGYELGLCSGTPHNIMEAVLSKETVLQYFTVIQGGDDVPFKKPDSRVLESVLTILAIRPCHAVFIGDTPTDEAMAESVGTIFLGVRREGMPVFFRTNLILDSLKKLTSEYLEAVSSKRNKRG